MAYLTLEREKLAHNYNFLDQLFKENHIEWAVVSKILCGNELFLDELLNLGVKEICDSRLENLKRIKELKPEIQTVYIKPPNLGEIEETVRYADVTFNSESETIRLLSEEAVRQNKTHKITIMIELGDLREGIMGGHLMDFYESIFKLPNIEVTSIGANLNCLNGVMPSEDKLIIMSLYKQLLDVTFNQKIPWVTGGTSVVIPLLFKKQIPKGINHFRVGESLFFGNNLFDKTALPGMKQNLFQLYGEIIELTKKPKIPTGYLGANPQGETLDIDEKDYGKESYRAILDVGLLDVDPNYLSPNQKDIQIIDASSDMLVIDLGTNNKNYGVGDKLSFSMEYMGALQLMNSDYIHKKVVQ